MNKHVDLLILAEGSRGKAQRLRVDSKHPVAVRELSSRTVHHIHAEEISLYRHTLLINGLVYRILDIFKLT
jgi:hypothetical protein